VRIKGVTYRKLGRHNHGKGRKKTVLGLAYNNKYIHPAHKIGMIEVDPRQSEIDLLDTEIHEALHFFTNLDEKEVEKLANKMSKFIWKLRYRKLPNKR